MRSQSSKYTIKYPNKLLYIIVMIIIKRIEIIWKQISIINYDLLTKSLPESHKK